MIKRSNARVLVAAIVVAIVVAGMLFGPAMAVASEDASPAVAKGQEQAPVAVTRQAGKAEEGQRPPLNPVGVGASWRTDVAPAPLEGRVFDPKEIALIDEIDAYFNGFQHMEGRFIQTDAQNQKTKGRFYVRRPGRFRFVYARPSRLVILSDGRYLSIEDYDLETVERYSLSSTPFGLLLTEKVDLKSSARITDLYDGGDLVTITLEDKRGEAPGRIKLFFTRKSGDDEDGGNGAGRLELKEWVVTDAQGLDTRIEITDVTIGKPADPKLFVASKIGLPGIESDR